MTNNWVDIKNANLILVQGGNPAEAHPVGFRWVIEAKKNGAKIIVVDPRFNRTASVADLHAPIRSGSDYLVIGRPITQAKNPAEELRIINQSIANLVE